jgi:hypothetical protein
MIGVLGFLVLNGAFAFAGVGILAAVGWVPWSVREALASLGLAFLTGLCALLLLGTVFVTIGVAFSMPVFLATAVAIGVATLLFARRRRPTSTSPETGRRSGTPGLRGIELVLLMGLGLVLVGWLVVGGIDSAFHPLANSDGWAIWANKGVMLSSFSDVPPPFSSDEYTYMHLDYPIVLPLLESLMFRATDTINTQLVHLELWLMLVAFCGALGYLARRLVSPVVWILLAFAVAFAPGIWGQLQTAYADVPMALLLGIGVLLLGLWVSERNVSQLALATLFLAAAASTKNEGLTGAVCALVAAGLIVIVAREWQTLKHLAAAGAGFVLMLLPWRIWIAAHDISSDLPVRKGLEPGYLADRAHRVWPSMKAFEHQLIDVARWSYLVPLGIAVALAALYASSRSEAPANTGRVALFYLLTGVGFFLAITWAFTITADPLDWQISTSANRVITGIVLISVAAIAHLSGLLTTASSRSTSDSRSGR